MPNHFASLNSTAPDLRPKDPFKTVNSPRPLLQKEEAEARRPETLTDRELLDRTQLLVQKEREMLTDILHHLKEVERRKLYSDLGFKSLFDYAVRELGYSEGQAGRRIAAMKLLRELPQQQAQDLEQKIESGALNLTNICQAQRFFSEVKRSGASQAMDVEQKLEVLKDLEHQSSRQAQATLLQKMESAGVGKPLPKERSRVLKDQQTELKLVLSPELLAQLEEVRSLLGSRAFGVSWAELIQEMAALSKDALMDKKFGKERDKKQDRKGDKRQEEAPQAENPPTPAPSKQGSKESSWAGPGEFGAQPAPGPELKPQPKPRSISKSKRYRVWKRDKAACVKCGSKEGLQVDHIIPVALGGGCEEENLRLLCFACNSREGIKEFGLSKMRRG